MGSPDQRRAQALDLARRGFHVFPAEQNGKRPAYALKWKQEATRDEDKIKAWWSNGRDYNVAISTDAGYGDEHQPLLVVDVDVKDNRPGRENFDILDSLQGFPPTLTCTTASGGEHHFYFSPDPVKTTAGAVAEAIDIRADGGYVIAAGSEIDANRYEWANDAPIAPAPVWLIEKANAAARARTNRTDETYQDDEATIARAADLLKRAAANRPAIQGQAGDLQTFKVAAELHDLGISPHAALAEMLEHYNPACVPPWDPDDLEYKIASAYKSAQNRAGARVARADEFQPVVPQDVTRVVTPAVTTARRGIYALAFDEIVPDYTDKDLIEDFLEIGAFSVMYGAPNAGKSFIALDMAFAVASGRSWAGRYTKQGAVVYIAAEGGQGVKNRVEALRQRYQASGVPFYLIPCPVNLMSSAEDARALVAILEEVSAKHGGIALVVVDTLARTMGGADENSAQDMGVFVRNVDQMRANCRAHFLVVHHSGKDASKGGRGSSALLGAIDAEFEIADGQIITRKQRDGEKVEQVDFELEVVELGRNARGKVVRTCTVSVLSKEDAAVRKLGGEFDMEPRDQILYTAFLRAMAGSGYTNSEGARVITSKIWHEYVAQSDVSAFKKEDRMPVTEGSYRTATSRARSRLEKSGKIKKINGKEWSL